MDTRPGVLKIEDCIDACRRNSTCLSVNYETGLCVLFSGSAEETPGKTFIFKKKKQTFVSVYNCAKILQNQFQISK